MPRITMSVPDISCGHCVAAVQEALRGVAGVSSVEVSLETKRVTLALEGGLDPSTVLAAVRDAGYTPELASPGGEA